MARSALCDELIILMHNKSHEECRAIMRRMILDLTAWRVANGQGRATLPLGNGGAHRSAPRPRMNGGTQTSVPHANSAALATLPNTSGVRKSRKMTKVDLKCNDPIGPKRSLNAWMGFRCYYLLILAGFPQKVISKVMTMWWRYDLFGAKWTLLAKAYSIVRGSRAKEDAPLAEFFAICAPMVGVVPPAEYLQRNGWQLGPPEAGSQDGMPTLTRLFTPTVANFPAHFATTTLSVDDLVHECYRVGYVTARIEDVPNTCSQGSLNMVSMPTVANTTAVPNDTSAVPNDAAIPDSNIDEDTQHTLRDAAPPVPYWLADEETVAPELVLPAAGQTVLAQAAQDLINAGSTYPHNDMFAPSSQMVSFNPAAANEMVADDGLWDNIDFEAFLDQ